MKKILLRLALLASVAAFASACESMLDIPQKGVVPMEDYYKTDEDAEAAVVAMYSTFKIAYSTLGWNEAALWAPWTLPSDEVYAAGNNKADNIAENEINSFRFDNNNYLITGAYGQYYQGIYSANLVIDNFGGEKADTPVKQHAVAVARVLRAHAYLLLTMGWGTPPLIEHVIGASTKPANSESQEFMFNWIVGECEDVIGQDILPVRESKDDMNATLVVTDAFARGVMAKAMLYLEDWEGVKSALKPVVDATDKYDLVPSDQMDDLFHVETDGCSETIFEFNLVWDASVPDFTNISYRNVPIMYNWRSEKMFMPNGEGTEVVNNGWGEYNPSQKFVDALLEHDGINSARRKAWIKNYDEVLYEMPYTSDADAPTLDDKKKDPNRGIHAGDGLYGHCGWFPWKMKYRPSDLNPSSRAMYNFPVMRLPEVLLMYAEACAMTGDPDGSGLRALNRIQERAQSQYRSSACVMEDVKTEKFLELWLEGHRYADLVRWGDAEKELADNGKYYPSFCDAMFTKQESEHRGYVEEGDADWCLSQYPNDVGFKKGKHELFPFPFSDIQINPNIKQNPGWTTEAAE